MSGHLEACRCKQLRVRAQRHVAQAALPRPPQSCVPAPTRNPRGIAHMRGRPPSACRRMTCRACRRDRNHSTAAPKRSVQFFVIDERLGFTHSAKVHGENRTAPSYERFDGRKVGSLTFSVKIEIGILCDSVGVKCSAGRSIPSSSRKQVFGSGKRYGQ